MVPPAKGSLRITGVVRDARGPVAGAQVSASRVDADTLSERPCPQIQPDHHHPKQGSRLSDCCSIERDQEYARLVEVREGEAPVLAQTVTDDDGAFALDGLSAGALMLWALGDSGAAVQPDVEAGSDGVMLTLEAGIFLAGEVVDVFTREPIPGAQVTLVHETGSRFFDALADAQGRFRVGPLPPGRYVKVASSKGWRTKAFSEDFWLDTDVDVTLELQRKVQLAGVVVTSEGLPASGLTVHLSPQHESGDTLTTRSDARGRFLFEEAPAISQRLWAWTEDETAFGEVEVSPPENTVLRLKSATFIEGTVRDEQGIPVERVDIRLEEQSQRDGPSPSTFTDEAGHYRLGPLPRAYSAFSLRRERYQNKHESLDLSDSQGNPRDFTLVRAMSVEGIVVDTRGTPLPGVQLKLSPVPNRRSSYMDERVLFETAVSDENGSFIVDSLGEGADELLAETEGLRPVRMAVEVPSTGIRVVIHQGASVSGTVVDARGTPMPNVDLFLWDTAPLSGGARTTRVDGAGAFAWRGLEEGHYVVEARLRTLGSVDSTSQPVVLQAGTAAHVSLRFEEGRALRGMTVDTDGRPIPGVRIQACIPDEDVPAWVMYGPTCKGRGDQGVLSGPDGRFVLKDLRAPAYQLVAWKEGLEFAPARSRGGTPDLSSLQVGAGADDVRLVLERRPHLRGKVVSEDGAPLPFRISGGNAPAGVLDGMFDFPLEQNGSQSIVVSSKGFHDILRELNVSPGEDVDLGTLVMVRSRTARFMFQDEATRIPLAGVRVEILPSYEGNPQPFPHLPPLPFRGLLDAHGGAEVEGLPFAPIVFSVGGRDTGRWKDVALDATQETVTVQVPNPNR
ncbi:carboxypeptidase regulatory-like domain-containing protein [Corallococcus exiguus]|uniref:carboxypeptidase regulatory-like domain-containing protein n=1 Tax=Corallococcus exiguus TaxID=83462 RepID=UPI0020A6364C|nr:carboxypeptidase regulatory-like domain-containing protein [Corallococcus exiguus]